MQVIDTFQPPVEMTSGSVGYLRHTAVCYLKLYAYKLPCIIKLMRNVL